MTLTRDVNHQSISFIYENISDGLIRIIEVENLQLELSSSPVSPFGIVSNCVACLHSDPLWDWPVLLLLLGQLLLNSEGFVRGLWEGG